MAKNELDSHGASGGEKLREDALRDRNFICHKYQHPEGSPATGEFSAKKGEQFKMSDARKTKGAE